MSKYRLTTENALTTRMIRSPLEKTLSPRDERKRLPSLDGSTDSMNVSVTETLFSRSMKLCRRRLF